MSFFPAIDYTARTQETTFEALNAWVKVEFPKDWQDVGRLGVAQAMLRTTSWMHGQRAFYYDRLSINAFLLTCDTREACQSLCRAIGYRMRPKSSASVAVRAYPNPTQTVPITLRQGTEVPVGDLTFEVPQDYTIPASKDYWPDGTTSEIISISEGLTREDTFVSDGTPFQEWELSHKDVIDGSVQATALGQDWDLVDSVLLVEGTGLGRDFFTGDGADGQTYQLELLYALIDPDDEDAPLVLVDGEQYAVVGALTGAPQEVRLDQNSDGETTVVFGTVASGSAPAAGSRIDVIYHILGSQKRLQLDYDDEDRGILMCGDGFTGLIPPAGTEITVTYRTGGGTPGNIAIGDMDVTVQGYLPDGSQSSVRLYNYEPGSGGEPRETITHAKYYAPRAAKSNQRAVRTEDFNALGSTYLDPLYGAPAYASARLRQEKPELNEVYVAVWSRDADGHLTTAQDALKNSLRTFLRSRRNICVYITMLDGDVIFFDISMEVSLREGYYSSTVFAEIQTAIQDYFDSALVRPGDDLSISALYDVVTDIDGVYRAIITDITGSMKAELQDEGDGATQAFSGQFDMPDGVELVGQTLSIIAESQTASDDGDGNITGDVDASGINTIDYETGKFTVTFNTVPSSGALILMEMKYIALLEWEEDLDATDGSSATVEVVSKYRPIIKREPRGISDGLAVSFTVPEDLQPIVPRRLFFISGYGPAPLTAYDDGEGNIQGDVLAGGTVDYITGEVNFTWNAVLPVTGATCNITLNPVPDGVTRAFTWTANAAQWLILTALGTYQGRLKINFGSLWTGFGDVYDNWQQGLDGIDIDHKVGAYIYYSNGQGWVEFTTAPPAGAVAPQISVVQSTIMLYSAFVYYIENLSTTGFEKYVYADNTGELWGTHSNSYPTDRLDHLTGHLVVDLSGSPVSAGRTPKLSYDSYLRSNERDLPVDALQIGGAGTITLTELEQEIDL
jgi:hypothetical protein